MDRWIKIEIKKNCTVPSHSSELPIHPTPLSWLFRFFALHSFGSQMIPDENIINLWASALADPSNAFKGWDETGDWEVGGWEGQWGKVGIITARPILLPQLLSFGLNLFIHSRNIYEISSMCWTLEIQFIYSFFHSAVCWMLPLFLQLQDVLA